MYDYIIITHIPAFYKVNLYHELAKRLKILVVFIAQDTQEKRADDFSTLQNANFSYEILSKNNFQVRNVNTNIKKLKRILQNIKYKKLLVSGWDLKEFWYLVFFYPKAKNCLALESTVFESKPCGIKGLIKKIFLSRISTVFASGDLHVKLLEALQFKNEIRVTRGVGIINKINIVHVQKNYEKKFVYIGRLLKIKNLEIIIKVFNELPTYKLTIIGDGEEKKYLQSIAKSNIFFKSAIKNTEIQNEFLNHNIFILPSFQEPWGLVVEEALYFGLPVLVSNQCGSRELIEHQKNGFIFSPFDPFTLKELILNIDEEMYKNLINYIHNCDMNVKDKKQIESYL